MTKNIAIGMFLALLSGGCFQQIAINSLGDIIDTGFDVLNREQDLTIAEQSIASNLKLLETVIERDPDNTHYLLLASIGYSSYALGFAEDDNPDRARLFYNRGKEYGLRILTHNESFKRALAKSPDAVSEALNTFGKEDVPAVFWTAVGWGSAINLSLSDPSALADLPIVERMMRFVLERDSAYFHASAHSFLGVLYGGRPKILGGNPDSARDHFDRCLHINGGTFLMSYILFARSYAVQTQDRALFEQLLTTVDTTSIDILPDARLSNAVAKKKARILRSRIDELF